jgi:hypothetical protein
MILQTIATQLHFRHDRPAIPCTRYVGDQLYAEDEVHDKTSKENGGYTELHHIVETVDELLVFGTNTLGLLKRKRSQATKSYMTKKATLKIARTVLSHVSPTGSAGGSGTWLGPKSVR